MHDIIAIVVLTIIICLSYVMYLNNRFDNQISNEHTKAMRFYLDRQLVARLIGRLLEMEALHNIINDATRYLSLDKILIYKILNSYTNTKNPLVNEICNYMHDNLSQIQNSLSHDKFLKIEVNNGYRNLLIQYLDLQKEHLIIYAINTRNALDHTDIELVTDSITPIISLAYIMSGKNGGFEKT
jgi:hypothetical protein